MTVKLAVENSLKSYKNLNVEVDQRTGNNRLIFLLENVVHASHVIKELESFDYHGFTESYLLSTPLLHQVRSLRTFIAGNFTPEEALHLVYTAVLDTLNLRDHLFSFESTPLVLKTCVRCLADDQLVEWDCLHESEGA